MTTVYGVDQSVTDAQIIPLPDLKQGKRKVFLAEDDQALAMRALKTLNMNEFEATYLNPAVVATEGPQHIAELIGYFPDEQSIVIADLDYQLLKDQGVDFSGVDLLQMISELTKPQDQRRQYEKVGRIYLPLAAVVTSMDSAIDPESLDPEIGLLDPFSMVDGEYQGGFKVFGARKEMARDGKTPANYDFNLVQTIRAIYRAEENMEKGVPKPLTNPLNEAWM